tara:strand:+ start:4393 stop:5481 length:1089 start_codon:yes stop_codon:yes gene_type:complete
MKILYISPENTVGTLTLWRKEHQSRGNECRTLTFFKSPKNFKEDICLNLPFNFTKPTMSKMRNIIYKIYNGKEGYFKEKKGYPPIWRPSGILDKSFIGLKDWFWRPIVKRAIQKYNLYDFDVVHFEGGMDFLKDEFYVKNLNKMGKKIICHYHGEDLRNRGVMPIIDFVSNLNLTNEVDLIHKHPRIEYLYLPFETSVYKKKQKLNNPLIVAHAPTNRYYKGSNLIIKICQKLQKEERIDFDLIENQPHEIAMNRKANADIFIDQIGDRGGWGYGMNSVESLSMGICTLTEINESYNSFIPDHPFVNIQSNTLKNILEDLIDNPDKIINFGAKGKQWVKKHHDIKKVGNMLYSYYRKIGLKC